MLLFIFLSKRREEALPYEVPPSERLLFLSRAAGSPTLELLAGLEPATCWLRISCSTDWATVASSICLYILSHFLRLVNRKNRRLSSKKQEYDQDKSWRWSGKKTDDYHKKQKIAGYDLMLMGEKRAREEWNNPLLFSHFAVCYRGTATLNFF